MKKGRTLQEKSMHQETTQKCWGRGTSSNWPHTGPAISLWWREQSCKMNKNNETWGRRTEPRWWKPRKAFDLFYRFRTLKTLKRRRHQIFLLHCDDLSQWEKQCSCEGEWQIMHSWLKCIVTAYSVISPLWNGPKCYQDLSQHCWGWEKQVCENKISHCIFSSTFPGGVDTQLEIYKVGVWILVNIIFL